MIACPLSTHGKVFGAITLVSAHPARKYNAQDLIVFEELARRAAIAIDNARLYHEAREAILARDEFLDYGRRLDILEAKLDLIGLQVETLATVRSVPVAV